MEGYDETYGGFEVSSARLAAENTAAGKGPTLRVDTLLVSSNVRNAIAKDLATAEATAPQPRTAS